MDQLALKVADLHASFLPANGPPIPVLRGIDLTLKEGELLGVLAPSGFGKSTLARCILNLLPPPGRITHGQVLLGGTRDLLKETEEELRPIRGKVISLIVSDAKSYLNPLLPIGTQIANTYRAHNRASKKEALNRAIEMLKAVGISDPLRRSAAYPHELSGGMAQRVVISMALVNSPDILLADEPGFGLDSTIQRQVLDLFEGLISEMGSSAIIFAHDMGMVAQYCQSVALLYEGTIVEQQSVTDFFHRPLHDYTKHMLHTLTRLGGQGAVASAAGPGAA